MWTLNWGTVSSHRRHSYAVPVQWLSGHPSPSTHTSLSAPPFALPPTGGCPRTFPNTGTTSTSPGHHHPARQPQLWRDTQPRLPRTPAPTTAQSACHRRPVLKWPMSPDSSCPCGP